MTSVGLGGSQGFMALRLQLVTATMFVTEDRLVLSLLTW